MKSRVITIALGLVALCGFSPGIHAQTTLKIPDGTIVQVKTTEKLSSATAQENQIVRIEAASDVKVNGVVVIPEGAKGTGHIVSVERRGGSGKSGALQFDVDYIQTGSGSNVRIKGSLGKNGGQSQATLMLGLVGHFKKGKNVSFPKGTIINAYVDGTQEVRAGAK